MGKLIKYELIKIMRRRSSRITALLSIVIIFYLFGVIAFQESVYNEDGTECRGIEAIAKQKKDYKDISGTMTDTRITEDIKEYQIQFNDPDNVTQMDGGDTVFFKDEVYWSFVCPKRDYYILISENYDNPFEYGRFSKLPKISLQNGADFYGARLNKIHKLLDQEYLDADYTPAEKNFWLKMNDKVEEPLEYGYAKGWINLLSSTGLWFFMVLTVCISIAPVFASEYQSGMDALMITAKYGRSKVICAKILASFLYGSGIFIINILFSIAAVLVPFGVDGWNLPVQIMDTICPYPLNFLEALFLYIGIAYVIVLAFISFTLVLSVSMKSPFPVLIVDAVVLIIPFFMSYSDTNYLYNHIYPLLPTKALEMSLSYFTDYIFGKIIVSWPTMIILVYLILAAVLLPVVCYRFRKYQIK